MSDREATFDRRESAEAVGTGALFDDTDLAALRQPVAAAIGCVLVVAVTVAIVEPRTSALATIVGSAVLLSASGLGILGAALARPRTGDPLARGGIDGAIVGLIGVATFALLTIPFETTYVPLFGAFVVLGLTFGCGLYPLSRGEHPFLGMVVAPAPLAGVAAGVAVVDLGVRGVGVDRLATGAEALLPITAVIALLTVWFAYVVERVEEPPE